MAKTQTLRDLALTKIKALYDIESEIIDALPKMIEIATDPDLKMAFEKHLEETKEQAKRLENCFDLLGEKPDKLKVEAIRGLVDDAKWVMKNVEEGNALDLALIGAGRYVEHYEMAGYLGAQEFALMLDEEDVASLLEKNLEEEQMAEEKLSELGTQIAERLNEDADTEIEDE